MITRTFFAGWGGSKTCQLSALCRAHIVPALCVLTLFGSSDVAIGDEEADLATFRVVEHFGVSHPEQIVDFDLDARIDAGTAYLLGPDGTEVQYQLLDGGKKIAVRTDLPAAAEKTWRLMRGRAPKTVTDGVRVVETEAWYEIVNGLTGVRVPKAPAAFDPTPAPVQGVRGRDGQWLARGPNVLSLTAKAMTVRLLEQGPLKVVAQVAYRLDRPAKMHRDREVFPAGEGFYTCTVTLQAGQPSVLLEEDSDCDLSYSLDFYEGLQPNQARYRGHYARSVEDGRLPDGSVYVLTNDYRKKMDATVDLLYDAPRAYRRMAIWDLWIYNSGWYWQFYDDSAPAPANFFGIFAGPASRAIGAGLASGVNLYTAPAKPGTARPSVGIAMTLNRGNDGSRIPWGEGESPTGSPRIRFAWGLFAGVQGEDLKPPAEIQPIARQMNLHGGINLNKVHRLTPDFPDPPGGYGAAFMDRSAMKRLVERLRTDKDFYTRLWNGIPNDRPLLLLLANPTGTEAVNAAAGIRRTAQFLLDQWVNGDGIYSKQAAYIDAGSAMMGKGPWIDLALADPALPPEDRHAVKATAALFAVVLWDEDFIPLSGRACINTGNFNMRIMQTGARRFYALLLANYPGMAERVTSITQDSLATVREIINEHGAGAGSVHYTYPSAMPTINTLLQVRQLGKTDPFATEPRLEKFAEFYMQTLTPPEVRFGDSRKCVAIGDGATEDNGLVGPLATGFRTADPMLSARLQGAWMQAGKPYATAFGTDLLRVDEDAPATDPRLGNAAFPGYFSVLRSGWGTPFESAYWLVNGDFYSDHRHQDAGSVVLYALGAPLSLDWGGQYYPQTTGEYMHSMVVQERLLTHPWNADRLGYSGAESPEAWKGYQTRDEWLKAFFFRPHLSWISSLAQFLSFGESSQTAGDYRDTANPDTVWRRTLTSLHYNPTHPVLLIRDTFTGPRATESRIFTLNLMAEGAVALPDGTRQIPDPRVSVPNSLSVVPVPEHFPSADPLFTVSSGLNRLAFTGQLWPKHPTRGIDWDLYLVADQPQQAFLGNWGFGNWNPSSAQFKAANERAFEEQQHILRVKGDGPFTALILPYRKGEQPDDMRVVREGETLRVIADGATTVIGRAYAIYDSQTKQALTTFSTEPMSSADIRIEGGPAEIVLATDSGTVAVHGAAGRRSFNVPGGWRIADPKPSCPARFGFFQRNRLTVDYGGGEPVIIHLERR